MRACSCPLGRFERDVHARPSVSQSVCLSVSSSDSFSKARARCVINVCLRMLSLRVHTVCAVTFQVETEPSLDCDTLNVREINLLNNRKAVCLWSFSIPHIYERNVTNRSYGSLMEKRAYSVFHVFTLG